MAAGLLAQWGVLVTLLLLMLLWQWPVVENIYFTDHPNPVGLIVNGLIVLIWAVSMLLVLRRLVHYHIEERLLRSFTQQIGVQEDDSIDPPQNSLIGRRYAALLALRDHTRAADQNALAAALVAAESARNGFLRFVYNVLILTGVLGTIIALSIALLGVSDLFDLNNQAQGLNSVLFGMSTALSTTMTAIIAYLLFGYFYIRLQDLQSYLLAQLEELTATVLIPKLGLDEKAEMRDYAATSAALRRLIDHTSSTQADYAEVATKLQETFDEIRNQTSQANERYADLLERLTALTEQQHAHQTALSDQTTAIARLLREGFRLNSD